MVLDRSKVREQDLARSQRLWLSLEWRAGVTYYHKRTQRLPEETRKKTDKMRENIQ